MKSKPNLPAARINVTSILTKTYENHWYLSRQNKPNFPNTKTSVTSDLTMVYENKPLSTKSATQIMQNKPNFPNARMTITSVIEKTYENFPPYGQGQNKPNQTQFQTCHGTSTLEADSEENARKFCSAGANIVI